MAVNQRSLLYCINIITGGRGFLYYMSDNRINQNRVAGNVCKFYIRMFVRLGDELVYNKLMHFWIIL